MIYNIHGADALKPYLSQWFYQDIVVISDLDIWACEFDESTWKYSSERIIKLLDVHSCKNVVVDLSQNAFPLSHLPKEFFRINNLDSNV